MTGGMKAWPINGALYLFLVFPRSGGSVLLALSAPSISLGMTSTRAPRLARLLSRQNTQSTPQVSTARSLTSQQISALAQLLR